MFRLSSGSLRKTCLAAAIVATFALVGCNRDNSATPSAPAAVAQLDGAAQTRVAERIVHPAWLRERLPEHTVAYARIPTLWSLMSAPRGRPRDAALASEAHTKLIASLRQAASTDKLLVDAGAAPITTLLLDKLSAPVEVAVIDSSDIANPASNVLVSLQFDVADVAALNERLAALGVPILKAPLDANGKGELVGKGYAQFDPATKRLHVLTGMAASAFALDGFVKQLGEKRAHAMHDVEKTFDTSGQGLFFWMSLKGIAGMASAQIPQAKPGTAVRDLIDKSQSVAFGWGTAGGRGKLQFRFAAPQARLLGYFAQDGFKADVKTAGRPDWAITMRLPTRQQFDALLANLDADFGAGTKAGYDKVNDAAKTFTGAEIKDFIGLFGPELISFDDAAGTYTAVRVADRAALYKRIDDLAARFAWKRETVASGKATVHHLYIPGIDASKRLGESEVTKPGDKVTAGLQIYSRVGTHLYWTEEGEYLVFGQVPQALADRAVAKLDTDIGAWMRNERSYDPAQSYLGIVGSTRHAQRKMYYAYLAMLQVIADLLGHPTSLADLPNAASLDLPVDGALGLSLDLTPNGAGFSVVYEQSPAEALIAGGGTMTTVAVVGILAAIAMPAYQDYTVRSQVATSIHAVDSLKGAVEAYYAKRKKLPESDESLDVPEIDAEAVKYLDHYWVDHGTIVLSFGDQANKSVHGQTLALSPHLLNGSIVWQCADGAISGDAEPIAESTETTTVPTKYLPADCR